MARKEDVFTVADFFEINTLCHWCKSPCVIKTQRYGYIWDYGSCAEPSHRTTVGCEKMEKGVKTGEKTKWFSLKKTPNLPNYFFNFPIIGSKIKVVVDPSSDLSKQARERH